MTFKTILPPSNAAFNSELTFASTLTAMKQVENVIAVIDEVLDMLSDNMEIFPDLNLQ